VRSNSAAARAAAIEVHADAGYLITGGLGGLGLQVAHWLAARGARHLILLGRSGLPPRAGWAQIGTDTRVAQQVDSVQRLEALGVHVYLPAADVGEEAQVRAALVEAQREGCPPIRGVIHAAGVLDHRSVLDQTFADLRTMFGPKIRGAWALHRVVRDEPIDCFVTFSSASAVLSSPRLSGYAAANAFLDSLAHYRRHQGQPALSVNWGVWSDVGMVSRFDSDDVAMIALRGMGTITPAQGLEALGRLMAQDAPQIAVLPVDWQRWQQSYPALVSAPFLAHVVQPGTTALATDEATLTREELLESEPENRRTRLEAYLASRAGRVLGLGGGLDSRQPLSEFGFDSLMAVELKNRLELDLGIIVPMVRFLEGPSIVDLTSEALNELSTLSAAGSVPLPPMKTESADAPLLGNGASSSEDQGVACLLASVDQLTDDQMDSLLAELLTTEDSVS
jgi:NAD(P)-dependent dehydrogenase (short-subunit alcohol dehydrogenase family)